MPLYLCTHAVEPSASVPLPMIVLLDLVKRKQILPATLRPRMVLPTSGATSVSVWDAPSAASLEAWLNEHLNQDVVHEVNEVQEDFSHGIAFELSRARTADRVAANSKSTLQKLSATASRAGDGFHRQLEALELGGSGGSFFGAAESALARIRGPPAATPPTSSAPSASSLGAQQDAADSMQVSRASSYYSWLQSKMKGTGLFPNHPPPRAAPPSTHASSYSHPSGLDMGLEGGAAPGMGLDAAAVAASTGPLPPSYAAAASAPSWEEDEPFVIGNDVGDSGGGGDAFGGSSSAVTQGQGLTVEGRSQGEGRPAPQQQQQQQQQQQDVQQQQQQHQQQEQRQPGQQEQQGVDQVLKLEEDSSADQGNQQQQQQQQSVGMPDTTVGGSGAAGWQQQQPQQRRQQQQQQQQPNDAEKAPMFILGDDDDDESGGHNQ